VTLRRGRTTAVQESDLKARCPLVSVERTREEVLSGIKTNSTEISKPFTCQPLFPLSLYKIGIAPILLFFLKNVLLLCWEYIVALRKFLQYIKYIIVEFIHFTILYLLSQILGIVSTGLIFQLILLF
jgi:hypothetical protein